MATERESRPNRVKQVEFDPENYKHLDDVLGWIFEDVEKGQLITEEAKKLMIDSLRDIGCRGQPAYAAISRYREWRERQVTNEGASSGQSEQRSSEADKQ